MKNLPILTKWTGWYNQRNIYKIGTCIKQEYLVPRLYNLEPAY